MQCKTPVTITWVDPYHDWHWFWLRQKQGSKLLLTGASAPDGTPHDGGSFWCDDSEIMVIKKGTFCRIGHRGGDYRVCRSAEGIMSGFCSAHKHYEPGCTQCECKTSAASAGYGAWVEIETLPEIQMLSCRSDDVLGCWDNKSMATVYFDSVDMQWKDAEEGMPVTTIKDHPEHWHTILTHWCKLPEAP